MFYSTFIFLPSGALMGIKGLDVLGGEYLLHKIQWDHNERFSDIFAKCVRYKQNHHSRNAVVVLDDYPEYNKKTIKVQQVFLA